MLQNYVGLPILNELVSFLRFASMSFPRAYVWLNVRIDACMQHACCILSHACVHECSHADIQNWIESNTQYYVILYTSSSTLTHPALFHITGLTQRVRFCFPNVCTYTRLSPSLPPSPSPSLPLPLSLSRTSTGTLFEHRGAALNATSAAPFPPGGVRKLAEVDSTSHRPICISADQLIPCRCQMSL